MKNKIIKALVSSVVLILFMLIIPVLVSKNKDLNVYRIRSEKKSERYKGTIILWNVLDSSAFESEISSVLSSRIKVFESKHPYIYIEKTNLSAELANKKLENGEKPDIISFPLGFIPDSMLCSIRHEKLSDVFENISQSAIPYCFDTYRISADRNYFFAKDIMLPLSSDISEEEIKKMLNNSDIAYIDKAYKIPCCSLLFSIFENLDCNFAFKKADELFKIDSGINICTYFDSLNLKNVNDLSFYDFSRYTDVVRLIGCFDNIDIKKLIVCEEFCNSMLQKKVQKSIFEKGLLAVTEITEEDSTVIDFRKQEADFFRKNGIIPSNNLIYYEAEKLRLLSINADKASFSSYFTK